MSAAEFSVTVLDLPIDEATPLAAVFDEHALFCVDDDLNDPTAGRVGIYLGATYTSDRGGGGTVAGEHLPALLREVAPGATWLAWDEPYEDYLGTAALYAPDLGTWTGECDSSGEVYVPASALTRTLMARPAALAELTGLAWRERITDRRDELVAGPPTAAFVPASPPVCAEWNRPTGLIYIDDPEGGVQVVHAPPGPDLGEISEPMARAADAALRQAGWRLMPAAITGRAWTPAGHAVHDAQVYRPTPPGRTNSLTPFLPTGAPICRGAGVHCRRDWTNSMTTLADIRRIFSVRGVDPDLITQPSAPGEAQFLFTTPLGGQVWFAPVERDGQRTGWAYSAWTPHGELTEEGQTDTTVPEGLLPVLHRHQKAAAAPASPRQLDTLLALATPRGHTPLALQADTPADRWILGLFTAWTQSREADGNINGDDLVDHLGQAFTAIGLTEQLSLGELAARAAPGPRPAGQDRDVA